MGSPDDPRSEEEQARRRVSELAHELSRRARPEEALHRTGAALSVTFRELRQESFERLRQKLPEFLAAGMLGLLVAGGALGLRSFVSWTRLRRRPRFVRVERRGRALVLRTA